jgi:hypothetical protein
MSIPMATQIPLGVVPPPRAPPQPVHWRCNVKRQFGAGHWGEGLSASVDAPVRGEARMDAEKDSDWLGCATLSRLKLAANAAMMICVERVHAERRGGADDPLSPLRAPALASSLVGCERGCA